MSSSSLSDTPADDWLALRHRLSGLEHLQAMLRGEVPRAPMADTINITLHAVAPGRVVFRGTPLAQHRNPVGAVHGGWYGTLLDSAMGCAVMTGVPKGAHYTTLEFKINITRALPEGMEAEAVATLQHGGRSTAVAVAEVRGVEDGRLYATGSTTCLIMAG